MPVNSLSRDSETLDNSQSAGTESALVRQLSQLLASSRLHLICLYLLLFLLPKFFRLLSNTHTSQCLVNNAVLLPPLCGALRLALLLPLPGQLLLPNNSSLIQLPLTRSSTSSLLRCRPLPSRVLARVCSARWLRLLRKSSLFARRIAYFPPILIPTESGVLSFLCFISRASG